MVSLWPGPVKTEHIVEHVLSQGKFEIHFSLKQVVNWSYIEEFIFFQIPKCENPQIQEWIPSLTQNR